MGAAKYEALGIPYPLSGVPAMEKERARDARNLILDGLQQARKDVQH